jgi:hypothetical protein
MISGRGRTSMNARTSALMTRFTCGVAGSLEKTRTALEIGPVNPVVSTSASILPLPPGGTVRSKSATVQPHVGRTWLISNGAAPVLRTWKVAWIFSPFDTVPKSLIFSAMSMTGLGPSAALGACAGVPCCAAAAAPTSSAANEVSNPRVI